MGRKLAQELGCDLDLWEVIDEIMRRLENGDYIIDRNDPRVEGDCPGED